MAIRNSVRNLPSPYREFFLVSLLQTAREFSRASSDGGWFRWVEKRPRGRAVRPSFRCLVEKMIEDVKSTPLAGKPEAEVAQEDARSFSAEGLYDAVVTSPPYPNRHDYTRVFHIELLALGLSEPDILDLRHRSLRSHVEAQANGHPASGFTQPEALAEVLSDWPADADRRVPRMLAGYFEDMHGTMSRLNAALRFGGSAAFVVGNVRHVGRLVPVDEVLAQIAPQAGLRHEGTWVIRERGNSAQQMGKLGRVPSRESVVFVSKS